MAAEKYFPFRSVSGDRRYSAEDWAAYFALFLSDGVFYSNVSKLKVVEYEGMKVKVGKGAGFIAGRMYILETDKIITLDTADGKLNRIDRIVLRCDYTNRKIITDIVKGSYSEKPTAPELHRNSDIYELALADIYVAAGVIKITQANITDQRLNTNLCGIVTGLVEQADTEDIFNQFTAYLEEFKQTSREEFDTQLGEWDEEFNIWFDGIREALEGDIATQLVNRIVKIENGTTQVGNAAKLNGHGAEYFVEKINGKTLSTNDYTTEEKEKLSRIEENAQENVQPDWNQTDNKKKDFIKNKPTILQSDWEQTDSKKNDFIKNKPTIPKTADDIGALPTSGGTLTGKIVIKNSATAPDGTPYTELAAATANICGGTIKVSTGYTEFLGAIKASVINNLTYTPVVISNSAPSDTTALWIDTSA